MLRKYVQLATLVTAMLCGFIWFYTAQQRLAWNEAAKMLNSVAKLRAEDVSEWYRKRVAEAVAFTERPLLTGYIADWLIKSKDNPEHAIVDSLIAAQSSLKLNNVLVLDAEGAVRLSVCGPEELSSPEMREMASAVIRDKIPVASDLYMVGSDPTPLMAIGAPVFSQARENKPLAGVIITVVDLNSSLFPQLAAWPIPTVRTGETYLVRRVGENLQYISKPRLDGAPQSMSLLPTATMQLSAIAAVNDDHSAAIAFTGKDYRAVQVFTARAEVPGTSWKVIAEIDTSEAFAEWHRNAVLMIVLFVVLLAFPFLGAGFLWQTQRKDFYKQLAASAIETQRMNRMYDMLSQTNKLIVRAKQQEEVLEGVAKIAVEHGGFLFAWIGVPQDDCSILPIALAGADKGYLDLVKPSTDPTAPGGQGPSGTVVRTGKAVITNNFLAAAQNMPWRDAVKEIGVRAQATYPIRFQGGLFAVFNVYSDDENFFEGKEVDTIDEMVTDISFALDNIRRNEEHERAVEQVQRLSERMKSYLSFSPVINYALRLKDGSVTTEWISENIERILGYTTSEAMQMGWWRKHVHPDYLDVDVATMNLSEIVGALRFEYLFRRKDGSELWILDTLEPTRDVTGKVVGGVGAWLDITEQKKAIQALQASEIRYRYLFESNPHPMMMYDRETLYYIAVNEAAIQHYGYSRDEFLQMQIGDIRPAEDIPLVIERIRQRGEGFVNMGVWRHKRRNGEIILVDISSSSFEFQGRHVGLVLAQDVTARVRAEKALAESEERLRLALSAAGQGLWDLDVQSGTATVSAEFEGILGYAPGELDVTTQWWLDTLHPDDLDAAQKALEECIGGQRQEYSVEIRQRTKQGAWKWVLSRGNVTAWNESGQAVRMLGTYTDISELKEAQDLLRLQSASLEAAANGIIIADRERRIVWVNTAFEELTGFSLEESKGRTTKELLRSGKAAPELYSQLDEAMRNGKPWEGELVNRRKDGSLYDEYMSITPIYDASGSVTHTVDVKQDITERNRARIELQASQARYSKILETVAVPLACARVDGTISFMNRNFTKLFGYLPEDLPTLEEWWTKAYPDPSYQDWVRKTWVTSIRESQESGEDIAPEEYVVHCKNGDIRTVEIGGTPIGEEFIVTFLDVTQRKHAAEMEVAKKTAEAASLAKSSFLATMSHEIRTPMNGIIGTVDLLRQMSLPVEQSELVEIIHDSAHSLLTIISDILDFSKIEAGKMELEYRPVAVSGLVESLCSALSPVAVSKNVVLTCFTDPRLPDWIQSDSVRLRQILNNLVGNAIKFSASNEGCAWVNVRAEWDKGKNLVLSVADNGMGISPEVLDELFKPFMQADGTITRRFGGTGLGLSICKNLVTMLRGSIEVKSTVGEGSVFTVTLPAEVTDGPPKASEPPELHGISCVLVSESENMTEDWRRYLESAGANVAITGTLSQVAAAVGSNTFDAAPVVIVDCIRGRLAFADIQAAFASCMESPCFLVVTSDGRRCVRKEDDTLYVIYGDVLRRDTLLHGVALAAGRAVMSPDDEAPSTQDWLEAPTVEEALAKGQLILVAEDNEINQKVLRYQLGSLGYACEMSNNGEMALELWRMKKYALLLTDLHMPVMDGYTLAASIRKEEPSGEHLPIVAFTANISRGEPERCRIVGMDGYMTKPVSADVLKTTLAKWIPRADADDSDDIGRPQVGAEDTGTEQAKQVFDIGVLTAMSGGRTHVIKRFLDDYLRAVSGDALELQGAYTRQEWIKVGAFAHRLKSSSRSVGAMALGEYCEQLEQAGKSGDGSLVSAIMPAFNECVDKTVQSIVDEGNKQNHV